MLQALPLAAWADVVLAWSPDGWPRWLWHGEGIWAGLA